jgi:hypothetical protein
MQIFCNKKKAFRDVHQGVRCVLLFYLKSLELSIHPQSAFQNVIV